MTRTKKHALPALVLVIALLLSLCSAGVAAYADSAPASSTTFTFSSDGITASGAADGYKIDGTTLKIKAAGVYTITGSGTGNVQVNKGVTGVTLILSDLTLANSADSDEAAIAGNKGSETTIYVLGTNTIADNGTDGAAIKAKAGSSLTIEGTGVLNVNGSVKNGVKSADASTEEDGTVYDAAKLTIRGATINITAANDGINAGGDLLLVGGTITVSAGDDGIHSDAALTVDGADITITKSYEGLEGATIVLNSGTGHITASDDGVNAAADGVASSLTINGGCWWIDAGGDGLDAGGDSNGDNGTITLNGGTVEVYGAANDGNGALDAGRGITYNGGTLLAVGMSGMAEYPSGDKVLAFGSAGMGGGMMGGMQGMNDRQSQQGQAPAMGNNGGAPSGNFGGNQQQGGQRMGLMAAGGFTGWAPNGGSQGGQMGGQQQPGNQQTGGMNQMQTASNVSISAGSVITIADESGNTVYTATAVKRANSVVFASDSITSSGTYTLYVDGNEAATATAGTGAAMGGMQPGQQMQQPGMNQNQNQQGQQAKQGSSQQGANQTQPQQGNSQQQGQLPAMGQNQQGGFGGMDRQPTGGMEQGQAPGMGGQQMGGFGSSMMQGRQQFGGFMGR